MYSVAANLFGAVKIVLYRRTQTLVVRSMYEAIIDFCERHEVDFNRYATVQLYLLTVLGRTYISIEIF